MWSQDLAGVWFCVYMDFIHSLALPASLFFMKNNLSRILFGVVILILVLATISFLFFKSSVNPQASNQSQTSEDVVAQENTEARNKILIPTGEVGQLMTMKLQVHGFEKAESISGLLFDTTQSKENTTFVLVDVSVTNTSNKTFTLYPKGILLANAEGVTYDTYLSTSGGVIGAEESAIDGRDLGNGIEERGMIVYEVPNNFVPYALEIEKLDTNDTLVFELPKVTEPEPKEVEYRVIEEDDISYAGCKRIGVRIVVPDSAEQRDVDHTLYLLARDYLIDWDDVTVWAWGYSEEAEVGASVASKGIYEETLPGFCN